MPHSLIPPQVWHDTYPVFYGWEACEPGHTFGPAVRDNYLVHYVFKGRGKYYRDAQCYGVEKGDIFVIRPGEVTTYAADDTDPWEYCWLCFHCREELSCLSQPVIRKPPVQHIFTWIRDHWADENASGKIFSLTYEFLWLLSENAGRKGSGSYAAYTKAYLENFYMRHVSIELIAKHLHIDRRHLTAVFRDAYGMPPQEFLTRLRMSKAKEFLEQGHSVTAAAAMCGCYDLANFSKHYKKTYGVSPNQHRNQKIPLEKPVHW